VQIDSGGTKYDAWVLYSSQGQINAILPSNIPAGAAQVTVTYNGIASLPAIVTVVRTSLGIFAVPQAPAQLGQIVIYWGTGLGPIATPDNLPPAAAAVDRPDIAVTITVGGIPAQRVYAGRQSEFSGVDNIYFTVPQGVMPGCQVPVVITAGGVQANATTIPVGDPSACPQ
jgi:uncharacterized protein (TIGR03437 family)